MHQTADKKTAFAKILHLSAQIHSPLLFIRPTIFVHFYVYSIIPDFILPYERLFEKKDDIHLVDEKRDVQLQRLSIAIRVAESVLHNAAYEKLRVAEKSMRTSQLCSRVF